MAKYTRFALCCAISLSLFQGITNVQRPYYMMSEHSRSRVAMEEHQEPVRKEPHSTIRKVYFNHTQKIPIRESASTGHPMTASKCCKLGERVAKKGWQCFPSPHSDYSYRTELMFRRQYSLKSAESSSNYKQLVFKVSKCAAFTSKFEKCCVYRTSFMKAMRRCRDLKGHERRQCRNKTRKSFGYTHK